jgi:hypothetical protein
MEGMQSAQIVTTTLNGKEFRGSYQVEHGFVFLRAPGADGSVHEDSVRLGASSPGETAKVLLCDMVEVGILS